MSSVSPLPDLNFGWVDEVARSRWMKPRDLMHACMHVHACMHAFMHSCMRPCWRDPI